ncbi:MAG: hypothetical protein R6U52_01380 [Kosmotogaceae bacterium]
MKDVKGNNIDASALIEREIILRVYDKYLNGSQYVQTKTGILRGLDHTHFYVLMTYGEDKGELVAFLRTDVKRIDPIKRHKDTRGVNHDR